MTKALVRGAALCYFLLLAFLSLNPWLRPVSEGIWDKVDHAIAYAGLTLLILFSVRRTGGGHAGISFVVWTIAMGISFFVGAALEIAQSMLTRNRAGSLADLLANVVGILMAYVIFAFARFVYLKWFH